MDLYRLRSLRETKYSLDVLSKLNLTNALDRCLMDIRDLFIKAIRSLSQNEKRKNKELKQQTTKLLKLVSQIKSDSTNGGNYGTTNT